MNLLRKEFLSYISDAKMPKYVPPEAETLFPGKFGKYYSDPELTQYMGKVVGTQWVPAKGAPSPAPVQAVKPQEEPVSPTQLPTTDAGATTSPDGVVVEPPVDQPILPPAALGPEGLSKSDTAPIKKEPRPAEILGDIFSDSVMIERGGKKISVRQVVNPQTKEMLDITDEQQRLLAIEIIENHILSLNELIKQKASRANQKISRTERQQIRKWLGNVGELFGLRNMLYVGAEAYLFADSYPKNDIAVIFQYGTGEEDVATRSSEIIGVSTKTSIGVKVGRKESNSLPFVMESVEGKTIQIPDKTGNMEDFYAEDAAVAMYQIFNQIYVNSTRGFIKRGTNPDFREERAFYVNDENLFKFDKDMLAIAIKEQQAAAARGESGGQKKFTAARKLLPSDVELAFDKNEKPYFRIVNRVAKNMEGGKTEENIQKAQRLVDHFIQKLRDDVMKGSADVNGRGYRLADANDYLTNNVAELLQTTGSEFIFQSDLMTVQFDDKVGFLGLTIVPGEVMRQRAVEQYGDINQMDTREQLINFGNWEINTRGMGLSSSAGGYLGPLPRVSPSMNLLKPTDYLTPEEYFQFLAELYRRRKLKQLEEYLWR